MNERGLSGTLVTVIVGVAAIIIILTAFGGRVLEGQKQYEQLTAKGEELLEQTKLLREGFVSGKIGVQVVYLDYDDTANYDVALLIKQCYDAAVTGRRTFDCAQCFKVFPGENFQGTFTKKEVQRVLNEELDAADASSNLDDGTFLGLFEIDAWGEWSIPETVTGQFSPFYVIADHDFNAHDMYVVRSPNECSD